MLWLKSPLAVWWLTVLLVTSFTAASYCWYKHNQRLENNPFVIYQQMQLQHLPQHSIVAIGNSRFKYALLPDTEIQLTLAKSFKYPPGFLRLIKSGANFQDFAPLTDILLARSPRLLILQIELLSTYKTSHEFQSTVRYLLLQKLMHPIRSISSIQWQRIVRDQNDVSCKKSSLVLLRQQAKETLSFFPAQAHLTEEANYFLRQAKNKHIPILIIAQPHHPMIETLLARQQSIWLEQIDRELKLYPNIVLLRFPTNLAADDYCDSGHLNYTGRSIFTQWLLRKVQVQLAGHKHG